MTELDDRLVRCFSTIFPALTEEEIRASDVDILSDTDSLAGVTLVALIDQEFGVEMEVEGLLRLRTFEEVQRYLHEQRQPSLPPEA
jgi:acyl carrier protein